MGLILCPNCGKETFDNERCIYCKYTLKEKNNNFPKDIYQYLKDDYLKTRNKAQTIQNCRRKFGLSLLDCKKIMDYIADEQYEKENYKSAEEMDTSKYQARTYIFSFWQYFVHSLVYKIIVILFIWMAACQRPGNPAIGIALLIAGIAFPLVTIYQWIWASSRIFIVEPNGIDYSYQVLPRNTSIDHINAVRKAVAATHYRVVIINGIDNRFHSFVVHGKIIKQTSELSAYGTFRSFKPKEISKICVPKYFTNNTELIKNLSVYIKESKRR